MTTFGIFVALFVLFYCIGKAADLVIVNIRGVAEKLGIKIFFLGLILGLLTSLPELSIGLTAIANGVPDITVGNLLGGIMVLFGLILGGSLVLNRHVAIDGRDSSIAPILVYTFLPMLLGLTGTLGFNEGVALVVGYIVLLWFLYLRNRGSNKTTRLPLTSRHVFRSLFLTGAGLVGVVVAANLIVRLTRLLLEQFNISQFLIGVIVFSIGTNLPEIVVTVRSWVKHIHDLSLANLFGSAIANAFILGIFAILRPIPIRTDAVYFTLMVFMALLFVVLFHFYDRRRSLTRKEGLVLIFIYLVFTFLQISFVLHAA